ncbi:hypothetical protein SDC9_173705 [bioreactor metagenome]|uniref:Uncharacterized protein n=1 Tax=bioreactor metagenome TaxID=1076179 RepID=A0A645GH42_9ZZZZ
MRHIIDKVCFDIRDLFLPHHIVDGNDVDPQNREQ